MTFIDFFKNFYEKGYKKFLLLPIILFLAIGFLIFIYPTVPAGIDLKGGTLLLIKTEKQLDSAKIESIISQNFSLSDFTVTVTSSPAGNSALIQFASNKDFETAESSLKQAKQLIESNPEQSIQLSQSAVSSLSSYVKEESLPSDALQAFELATESLDKSKSIFHSRIQEKISSEFGLGENVAFQLREIGPTIGPIFWQNALFVTIAGMIMIVIIIFLFFREIVPSLAVIEAALFDIGTALALMAVFQIPLSLSTIPALLMLVGYSIDTDILLTTRILKRRDKTPSERAAESMITGLTMTGTTIAAVTVMLVFSYFTQIVVMFEISVVLLFGLIGDLISTWFLNAPILLWYVEKKKKS